MPQNFWQFSFAISVEQSGLAASHQDALFLQTGEYISTPSSINFNRKCWLLIFLWICSIFVRIWIMYLDRDRSIFCIVLSQKSVHNPVSQLHTKSVSYDKYHHLSKNTSLKLYSPQTNRLNDNKFYYRKYLFYTCS